MDPCPIRIHVHLPASAIGQRTGSGRFLGRSPARPRKKADRSGWGTGSSSGHNALAILFWWVKHQRQRRSASAPLVSPTGSESHSSYRLNFPCTNNVAEYEALLLGLEVALSHNIRSIRVSGDSQLVINQITKEYQVMDPKLKPYKEKAITLLAKFDSVGIEHISRGANTMAQLASAQLKSTFRFYNKFQLYEIDKSWNLTSPYEVKSTFSQKAGLWYIRSSSEVRPLGKIKFLTFAAIWSSHFLKMSMSLLSQRKFQRKRRVSGTSKWNLWCPGLGKGLMLPRPRFLEKAVNQRPPIYRSAMERKSVDFPSEGGVSCLYSRTSTGLTSS